MCFLFSSFTGLPDSYFDGFCFVGVDYVSGHKGFKEYQCATGTAIAPGEDGCYVTIRRIGDRYQVGSDFSGYKKIFYYSSNGVWAISNSIARLARHLSELGVRLTVNYPELAAFRNPSTLTLQLSSFRTIFNEIDLLPSWQVIEIDRAGLQLANVPETWAGGYVDSLSQFANTWVGRFETLIENACIDLTVDLTGGTDSRVVFSLLEAARRRLGRNQRAQIVVKSSKAARWQDDLKVARNISKSFGLGLNQGSHLGRDCYGAEESFQGWFDLNAGLYLPIYFPETVPSPLDIHVHGGGGEKYRQFYKPMEPSRFVDEHMKQTEPRFLFEHWKRQFLEAIGEVSERRPNIDALTAHYGEFRNRLHAGRAPQYRVVVSPLASKLLDPVVRLAASGASGQLNFDLMESLVPGIAEFEFDVPEKGPSVENWRALTRVAVDSDSQPGRAYVGSERGEQRETQGKVDHAELFGMLRKEYESSKTYEVCDFAGSDFVSRADQRISEACSMGTFGKAANTREVACVITTCFAFAVAS